MHIPDGFLDQKTVLTTAFVSAVFVGAGLRKIKEKKYENYPAFAGILAAFVFAAQMLNFPIAAGISGHFIGALFLALILGPFSSVVLMFIILLTQSIFFQDGGITALGANVLNMGVVGGIGAYYIYGGLKSINETLAIIAGAIISVTLAAVTCSFELFFSGTVENLKALLYPMITVHFIIGIGEGLITFIAFNFLKKAKPEILTMEKI